jgi:hypothetical protein
MNKDIDVRYESEKGFKPQIQQRKVSLSFQGVGIHRVNMATVYDLPLRGKGRRISLRVR